MKRIIKIFLTIFIIVFVIQGCKDDDDPVATGILTGTVTDAISGDPLANVFINIFNDTTNAPIGTSFTTGSNGTYAFQLEPGRYFMKFSKHKYESVPLQGMNPIPFTIEAGLSFERSVKMFPDETTNTGVISGKVTDGTDPLGVSLNIFIKTFARGSPDMASVTVPVKMPVATGSSSSLQPWIAKMMINIVKNILIILFIYLTGFSSD